MRPPLFQFVFNDLETLADTATNHLGWFCGARGCHVRVSRSALGAHLSVFVCLFSLGLRVSFSVLSGGLNHGTRVHESKTISCRCRSRRSDAWHCYARASHAFCIAPFLKICGRNSSLSLADLKDGHFAHQLSGLPQRHFQDFRDVGSCEISIKLQKLFVAAHEQDLPYLGHLQPVTRPSQLVLFGCILTGPT